MEKVEELRIEDYKKDLNKLCPSCRKVNKCKDKDHICLAKRLLWNLSKREFKRRKEKGLL